jgi:transposase InsO family protein
MKAFARQYVYWPGIDPDIEAMVRQCDDCRSAAKLAPKQPLQPWTLPNQVFERVHLDFAGPCSDGKTYLVMVDSYSKWPEVFLMSSTTSFATIKALQTIIDRYGLPQMFVTDNGTQFKSHEFTDFCSQNGIKHQCTPPYHPQSNGQAERYVDILKRQMTKCSDSIRDWLTASLRDYRATPHPALEGKTPSELFLGRKLRTKLSLLQPTGTQDSPASLEAQTSDNKSNVHITRQQYQDNMVRQFNNKHRAKYRRFKVGNHVSFLNYRHGKELWFYGIITKVNGVILTIKSENLGGSLVRRHVNQVRAHYCPADDNTSSGQSGEFSSSMARQPDPVVCQPDSLVAQPTPEVRRSVRFKQPPVRFSPDPNKKSYY